MGILTKFVSSKFSGYALIALLIAAAGAGYWFWSELKEFGSLEERAEQQEITIQQQSATLQRIQQDVKSKNEALQRQSDKSQILSQQAGILRQKLQEASDAAHKALKECLSMRIADGMRFGPGNEHSVSGDEAGPDMGGRPKDSDS